jgi:hypothetical protein
MLKDELMKSTIFLFAGLAPVLALPSDILGRANCGNNLDRLLIKSSSQYAAFCSSFTKSTVTAGQMFTYPSALSAYATAPSKISEACSCAITGTSSLTSKTTLTPSLTTSTSISTTSSPISTSASVSETESSQTTSASTSSTSSIATTATGTFVNPVIYADFADNDVFYHNGTYYMSCSNMHYSPGAPILQSYDLVNWEVIGHSVPTLDFGSNYNLEGNTRAYREGTWASTMRYRESNGL